VTAVLSVYSHIGGYKWNDIRQRKRKRRPNANGAALYYVYTTWLCRCAMRICAAKSHVVCRSMHAGNAFAYASDQSTIAHLHVVKWMPFRLVSISH